MSHEIDTSNDRANIAYVGEKPWHNLGSELQAGQSIETWRVAAGLNWEAKSAPVQFQNGELQTWNERRVLYRSDTHAPLSVVAPSYHVVQPADILDLYAEIARAGGFELEVAGCLSGGRRVWAMAKVTDGAMIVGEDRVRPRILFATSYDGTMATLAKFISERVVCANTMAMALTEGGHEVRINHSVKWTDVVAKSIREKMGVVHSQFELYTKMARRMAERSMSAAEAEAFGVAMMKPTAGVDKDGKVRDPRETRGYKRIMELFNGAAIGAQMAGQTRWGMLNAVTQLIDHERGRTDSTRMESAWFGAGDAFKTKAARILDADIIKVD